MLDADLPSFSLRIFNIISSSSLDFGTAAPARGKLQARLSPQSGNRVFCSYYLPERCQAPVASPIRLSAQSELTATARTCPAD